MREPQRPEAWHRSFLDLFLDEAKELKKNGLHELVQELAPYAKSTLEVVGVVGYLRLYEEYKPQYADVGLLV